MSHARGNPGHATGRDSPGAQLCPQMGDAGLNQYELPPFVSMPTLLMRGCTVEVIGFAWLHTDWVNGPQSGATTMNWKVPGTTDG
jgi:hypothetical protein